MRIDAKNRKGLASLCHGYILGASLILGWLLYTKF